ncbi:MAG: hypothetical protein JW871_00450 [Endomicrobiales bacterium]|nr:hypothetical protein [Endomicrobiales bacterium]
MQEKVRLLMEETGCDQGEAELALDLAQQNLENAIGTIGSLLRHIVALKGKFYFPNKNFYGLILIVLNTKTQEILRSRIVISYNPSLYENSPKMDWYALEKLIFSYRLDEGSLFDFTQDIEQKLKSYFSEHIEVLVKSQTSEITELLHNFFKPDEIVVNLEQEELNLEQFRKLPNEDSISSTKVPTPKRESGTVWLQIEAIEDEGGKEANRLMEGEVIVSKIVDNRDIAHYLTHLIGSHRDGEMIPQPAVIRRITNDDIESEIQVCYAPGIMGVTRVNNKFKIKTLEDKSTPWWRKIIPWT